MDDDYPEQSDINADESAYDTQNDADAGAYDAQNDVDESAYDTQNEVGENAYDAQNDVDAYEDAATEKSSQDTEADAAAVTSTEWKASDDADEESKEGADAE